MGVISPGPMRRLWDASVWAPAGVAKEDWRFRGIFRFVLPMTDVFFCYFGVVGFWNGIASVEHAAGSAFAMNWCGGIAVSAFVALIGVAFPRLWLLETIAKIALIGLVSIYVALYLQRIVTDFPTSASTGLVLILILLPIWRVGDLGFVAFKRGHGGGPG